MSETGAIARRLEHVDPATRSKYESYIRKFDVTDETTWKDVRWDSEKVKNPNTRRSIIIGLRTILGSSDGAPRMPKAVAKVYDLPEREDIFALEGERSGTSRWWF